MSAARKGKPVVSKRSNNVPASGTQAPVTPLSNLAQQIVSHHQAAEAALRTCAEHAMAAGDLLTEAKQSKQIAHGQWSEWVEKNCKMSLRTAQVHMRLAADRTEIEAKAQSSAYLDLSIAGALKLISGPPKPKARSTAAQPRSRKVPAQYSGTGCDKFDSKAVGIMWTLWDRMPASDRCRFFEAIGLQAILDHIPATWVRAVERIVRPSDWKPSAEMPTACHDNDNLEIPACLQREPEKVH